MSKYFEAVPFKEKLPNNSVHRKVIAVNSKTNEVVTVKMGMATDWEYYTSRGFTHWIKPITTKHLKKRLL